MKRFNRNDGLAVAILLLLPTLFFADVLTGVANFAARDLTRYYYPTKQIYGRIVEGGEFPLWNRYFHGGQPLAANPEHEIFYPFTWLLMLPDYDLGYRLHILVHMYIALLAMYALLRSMRIGAPAALFGAVSWGLGGLLLSYINLLPILFAAVWLPATCLFVRRFLIEKRWGDFALASLFFGVQCLVGEPTTILQTGFLIGLYAIYRGCRSGDRLRAIAANLAWIALISGAAFAAGAVQLMPAIDHVGDSARAWSFPFQLVEAWSTPWAKLIELVYPNVLGHVQRDGEMRYWGGALYAPMGAPFLFSIYPGLAVVALSAAGLMRRARGWVFALAAISCSLVLALGGHTPLLRFLYDAGIATKVRYPEKFLLIGVFVITAFAAVVCERLIAGDEKIRHAAAGFALATALIAAAISLLGLMPVSLAMWLRFFGLDRTPETMVMAGLAWSDWSVAAVRGLVLFGLIVSVMTPRRPVWLGTAFLFLAADLGFVVHELNPRMPARFFRSTPAALRALDPAHQTYRIFHLADWEVGDRIGIDYAAADARYWIVKNGLFPMTPAAFGLQTVLERDYDETALLPTVELTRAMWEIRRRGRDDVLPLLMAMSNARYVALPQNLDTAAPSHYEMAQPVRFVDAGHSPRYYFADELIEVHGGLDFAERLASRRYSRRAAFVRGRPFEPAQGRVLSVDERANSAVIEVESEGRSFLVMSVTPHAYWHVTIDGRPVQPIVTNIGYQGIVIKRGRHRVVMRYRNHLIETGAVVSAIALAGLLSLAVIGRKRTS